jgi:hypothetical protein
MHSGGSCGLHAVNVPWGSESRRGHSQSTSGCSHAHDASHSYPPYLLETAILTSGRNVYTGACFFQHVSRNSDMLICAESGAFLARFPLSLAQAEQTSSCAHVLIRLYRAKHVTCHLLTRSVCLGYDWQGLNPCFDVSYHEHSPRTSIVKQLVELPGWY